MYVRCLYCLMYCIVCSIKYCYCCIVVYVLSYVCMLSVFMSICMLYNVTFYNEFLCFLNIFLLFYVFLEIKSIHNWFKIKSHIIIFIDKLAGTMHMLRLCPKWPLISIDWFFFNLFLNPSFKYKWTVSKNYAWLTYKQLARILKPVQTNFFFQFGTF